MGVLELADVLIGALEAYQGQNTRTDFGSDTIIDLAILKGARVELIPAIDVI